MKENNNSNIIMGNQIDNQIGNINDKSQDYLNISTFTKNILKFNLFHSIKK